MSASVARSHLRCTVPRAAAPVGRRISHLRNLPRTRVFSRVSLFPPSWTPHAFPSSFARRYHQQAPAGAPDASIEFADQENDAPSPANDIRMQRLVEAIASLDPFQRAVVNTNAQQLIVTGAAGSGKSYCIAARIASLIKSGEPSSQMLVLSMSDGQAKYMRNIVDIIAPLSSNAAEFVSLGSLISQILRDYASELGSPAEGARFCTKQEMEDFTRTHFHLLGFERYAATAGKATFVASFLGTVRQALIAEKRRHTDRKDVEVIDDLNAQEEVARAYLRFTGLKQRFNVHDAAQQANVLLNALEKRPRVVQELKKRYSRVFVDDVQNASMSQLRLLQRVWGNGFVFFTMDEDQGMSSGNASVLRPANVSEYFPQVEVAPLRVSHRCSPQLLSAAGALVSTTAKRLALVMNMSPISMDNTAQQEGGVEHLRFGTLFDEENGIASKIEELKTTENVQWGDFAVLARTRAEGLRIQQRLKQWGIPSRFVGEQRAADSPETAFLVSFLSALLHPADDRALYAVLQSPVYKVPEPDLSLITAAHVKSRKRLRAVLEELQTAPAGGDTSTVSKEGIAAVSSLLADVVKYEKMFPLVKTSALVQEYLKDKGLLDTYLRPETLALETQSRHIAHLLRRLEQAEPVLRNDRHQGLTLLLSRLGAGEGAQSSDDDIDNAVRLMTIHKAKAANAQAEVVFLAGAVEGRFPAQWTRPELSFELPFGSTQPSREQFLAEERNLVYVAMTRAKRRFYFVSANTYPLSGSLWPQNSPPSRFIAEALGFDPADLRNAESAPYPLSAAALPQPPLSQPLASAVHATAETQKQGGTSGVFALTTTDAAMIREGGIGPLTFDRWLTHSVCPLRYCFRYVHNIAGAGLQSDALLDQLLQKSAEDLLMAARVGHGEPVPQGAVREFVVEGTKDLIAVDVIENAFIRRLQEVSAPLRQSALPQERILEGMDIVRKFASREAAFLMGTVKAILSGENISFELPLSTDKKRTVLVQQPWQLALEGPEGIVLYTTEKLARRSPELAQLGIFMSVALRHCKPDSGPNLEWRSITSGKIQKSKISAKAALVAEAALVQGAEGIASGRFEARPSKRNCGACAYKDTCPSAFQIK